MHFLRNVARKDDSLDGSTVGDGLIRVNALVGFFAIEVIGHQRGDTGNASGTADKNNFMNAGFIDFRVSKDFIDGFERDAEEFLAGFFEAGASVNINALKEIQSRSKSGWLKKGHVRKRYGEDGDRKGWKTFLFVFAFEILNDVGDKAQQNLHLLRHAFVCNGHDH